MSRAEQKSLTRQRILDAAGRVFRRGGFGGVGVDGLAKEAGVTSGAFYVHFPSKAEAFAAAIAQGVTDVSLAIQALQEEHGKNWWPEFVRFYLGAKRQCDLSNSCGLQSLASEVARTDDAVRALFEAELRRLTAIIVAGPASPGAPRDEKSASLALATLIGSVTLARAVSDATLADAIASAAEQSLLAPGPLGQPGA